MTVKIVTDSVSDLPPQVAEQLGITVVPMYLRFGTETYRDGIDLTTEQFYDRLVHSKILPSTAATSAGNFAAVYDRLADETGEILVITVSRKFGAVNEVALQAVELMRRKCRVEVIDSEAGAMAEGLLVIAAAKAANAGANLDEVINVTRCNMRRVEIRFAFDTLEYLRRGGRIGRAQAFLGSMLRMNPVLGIKDGEAYPISRERSRAKVIEHLCNFAMSFHRIDEMAVEDATTPHDVEALLERLSSKFPKDRIYLSKVSPAVGTHVGPHVLALSVLGDRQASLKG